MNMRSTPDLITPSLITRNAGSQYSLNNNCFATQSSTLTSSSAGFSMQLLQNQQRAAASSAQPQLSQQMLPISQQQQQQQQLHRSLQELPQLRPFTPSGMPSTSSDVLHPMTNHVNLTPSINDLHTLQSLLPSYRHTPDYETAVQMKYGVNSTQLYFEGQSNSNSEVM